MVSNSTQVESIDASEEDSIEDAEDDSEELEELEEDGEADLIELDDAFEEATSSSIGWSSRDSSV
jgi:hypothetical protein